jgi:hypothetical protein
MPASPEIAAVCGPKHHRRGIRAVAYSAEHEVLISVGYDVTGFAWDVNSCLLQIKLVGHRAPLLDVKIVKHDIERWGLRWTALVYMDRS